MTRWKLKCALFLTLLVCALSGVLRAGPALAVVPGFYRARHAASLAAVRSANQQRQAAKAATAAQAAHATWRQTGKAARLIVIRPHVVDVVTAGQLTSRIQRSPGPLSVAQLAPYVPGTWLSTSGSTTLLSAAVALTSGTTLNFGDGTMRLVGGPDAASAASIWVGKGTLILSNATVTSWEPTSQRPPPRSAAGRPFIVVGSGGRLNATDATVSDLGASASPPGAADHTGVVFTPGSTGSLVRTKLGGNLVGLRLSGSTNVRLDGVTVADSDGDGLVLHEDHGTTLHGVEATRNAGNGVLVSGTVAGRTLGGVTTSRNGAYGVAVIRQHHLQVVGVSTSSDRFGGLRLTGCMVCTVTGTPVSNEPIGLLVNGDADEVTLNHVQVRGGRRGVVISHGAGKVALNDLVAWNVSLDSVVVSASDVMITGGRITGGHTGINFRAPGSIDGTSISGVAEGVQVAPAVTVHGTRLDVVATESGIKVDPRGRFFLTDSRIEAREALRGQNLNPRDQFILTTLRGRVVLQGNNTFNMLPFAWLGAMGVLLIAIAIFLEVLQDVRQRLSRRRPPRRVVRHALTGSARSGVALTERSANRRDDSPISAAAETARERIGTEGSGAGDAAAAVPRTSALPRRL